ncbi:hypothetical protein [Bradyrhizobium commune]|uniref:Uncharacterized protein n=1 Tax=Bradyrhizobium commune TaxID=83627 RepID=A0A7S9CZT0_9BRAD|nr:hypothetical protein [Bradyrhizobium commune]QPF88571.1 hypothetical protein IC761_18685 [Bradyrhizobium commune]
MIQEAEAATQIDAVASPRKADLKSDPHGLAFLATIAVVMTAWICGLVWAAIAFLNWVVS